MSDGDEDRLMVSSSVDLRCKPLEIAKKIYGRTNRAHAIETVGETGGRDISGQNTTSSYAIETLEEGKDGGIKGVG